MYLPVLLGGYISLCIDFFCFNERYERQCWALVVDGVTRDSFVYDFDIGLRVL